jgi:hypothetical protein
MRRNAGKSGLQGVDNPVGKGHSDLGLLVLKEETAVELDPHSNTPFLVPIINFVLTNYGKPVVDWVLSKLQGKKPIALAKPANRKRRTKKSERSGRRR